MPTRSAYPMPVLNASRVFGIPVLLDGSKPYFERTNSVEEDHSCNVRLRPRNAGRSYAAKAKETRKRRDPAGRGCRSNCGGLRR